ncbi:hypothetical protein BHM03_00040339 [Ensete ventricosum]|nr:hypothetical protein BHM03_00040339 [Ensete ventricosum]
MVFPDPAMSIKELWARNQTTLRRTLWKHARGSETSSLDIIPGSAVNPDFLPSTCVRRKGGMEVASIEEMSFHVVHKIPAGEGPYVRAKHLQLVEKDLEASILWFWKAINERDRVDSALKDMAVVMKQQDQAEEAVEAIKSFRHLCSNHSQDSLDNLLIDLYKVPITNFAHRERERERALLLPFFLFEIDTDGAFGAQKCGKVEEQIVMLKQKLRMIYMGKAFNGKTTKTARSHGKKFQVSIKQETARLLVYSLSLSLYFTATLFLPSSNILAAAGNLGWAYMQQANYMAAEAVYRKAQMIEPNANNGCNLGVCLINQGRYDEARSIVTTVVDRGFSSATAAAVDRKALQRAKKLLAEIDQSISVSEMTRRLGEEMLKSLDIIEEAPTPSKSKRLPVFEEISPFRDQMAF